MSTNRTQPTSCPQCGSPNPAHGRFCGHCGTPLTSAADRTDAPGNDPFIGKIVGNRFRVQERIGAGGMGVVYKAIQTGIERPVAIKFLPPMYAADPVLLQRFKNEATLASRLSHPNTVVIHDFGAFEDSLYLAMEYLDGVSLSALLKQTGALDWVRVCRMGEQICESLYEAHRLGIIHRDLKPDNVLVLRPDTPEESIKVLDFGIAKMRDRAGTQQLTGTGEIFGTPEYMSPEQIRGDDLTAASDIYALGVLLYVALTGFPPFRAPTPMGLLAKHLAEDPPAFSHSNSTVSVPADLESLTLLCLAKNPHERPQSMRDIALFLRKTARTAQPTLTIESSLRRAIADKSEKIRIEHARPQPTPPAGTSVPKRRPDAAPGPPSPQKAPQAPAPAETGRSDIPPRQGNSAGAAGAVADTAEDADDAAASAKQDILDDLIAKMKRKRDFPAVSKHISELNAKAAMRSTNARQLANVILKDYSLTSKLLKLINSPYYGQVRGKITTVSRAVVLMGFDQVRQSALGLLLFDHFGMHAREDAAYLSNALTASLLAALTARNLAHKTAVNPEEVFVCALMRNLGSNVIAFYFPKKFRAIQKRIAKGEDNDTAARAVLGVTFHEVATELAKRWNLPPAIVRSMDELPPGEVPKPRDAEERLRNVAALANELTETAIRGDIARRKEDIAALRARFESTCDLTEEEIPDLFDDLAEKFQEYADAMNLGFQQTSVVDRIRAWSVGRPSLAPHETSGHRDTTLSIHPLTSYTPEQLAKQEQVARQKILLQGIDEVAAAVSRHDELGTIVNMVLETLLRGLNLTHVLFALYDPNKDVIRARSGYGDDIDGILAKFHFKPSRSGDLFTTSLAQARDVAADLEHNRGYLAKLPQWYKDLFDPLPRQFAIYPLIVNTFPAGLLYGDIAADRPPLSRTQLSHVPTLRGHLVRALKRSLPKLRRR